MNVICTAALQVVLFLLSGTGCSGCSLQPYMMDSLLLTIMLYELLWQGNVEMLLVLASAIYSCPYCLLGLPGLGAEPSAAGVMISPLEQPLRS